MSGNFLVEKNNIDKENVKKQPHLKSTIVLEESNGYPLRWAHFLVFFILDLTEILGMCYVYETN